MLDDVCRVLGAAGAQRSPNLTPRIPLALLAPFPPGGVAELTGRPATIMLTRYLKQPFVLINLQGIGRGRLALALPQSHPAMHDGYDHALALASVSTNPEADRMSGRPPAFVLEQLAPIALLSADPVILTVRADSPYRTLRDLVDDARRRPDAINYSSSGNYGTYHVATEMFTNAAGIKMKHIPYSGGGPALTALLGGQVDVGLLGPSVAAAQIKAGKLCSMLLRAQSGNFWLLGTERSPWYASMRILRQNRESEWADVARKTLEIVRDWRDGTVFPWSRDAPSA